jgi:beta-phosphoglucomutase family hydrolase
LYAIMQGLKAETDIAWEQYDAVLFDLDGVLTDTAGVHAACWKRTFDEFLRRRADRTDDPFQPFDIESDYRLYVDGKRRYDGVRDFLHSRGIDLPEGSPGDPSNAETVCGVGNRKNVLVNEALQEGGVEVYPGSVALVRALRDAGKKTGVVSSSSNCAAVLRAADIDDLFDVRVDGKVAAELDLPGKPAPDTFLEAARQLSADSKRTVVVEDAISGVQAGRKGGFGLVIGISRHDEPGVLRENGADVVVSDLGELSGPAEGG